MVERFELDFHGLHGEDAYMAKIEDGEFVRYSDYVVLEAQLAATKVTDEMVDAGARAIAKAWGENWECCCTERKGLDCDCGDAMADDRYDSYDERLSRDDCRIAARAALTAAQEAGQ